MKEGKRWFTLLLFKAYRLAEEMKSNPNTRYVETIEPKPCKNMN